MRDTSIVLVIQNFHVKTHVVTIIKFSESISSLQLITLLEEHSKSAPPSNDVGTYANTKLEPTLLIDVTKDQRYLGLKPVVLQIESTLQQYLMSSIPS